MQTLQDIVSGRTCKFPAYLTVEEIQNALMTTWQICLTLDNSELY